MEGFLKAPDVPTSLIELSISCEQLINKDLVSKSDPQCVVRLKNSWKDDFIEIGRTEVIKDCLNPKFVKKFLINYNFESVQKIKFEIWDIDEIENDFLGSYESSLAEIVSFQGNQIKHPLNGTRKNSGYIILSAEEVSTCKQVVTFQLKASHLKRMMIFIGTDAYFTISRANEDNSRTIVFKSEVCKNSQNPIWKPATMKVTSLNNGDNDRTLTFNCFDKRSNNEDKLIGSFDSSLNALLKDSGRSFELKKPKKDKIYGTVTIVSLNVREEPSFVDFIRSGTQLHFAVAIDFTASNGRPDETTSLHYIDPYRNSVNGYEIALRAVGEIIQQYSSNGMFPAFGFGAKVNGQVSHQFPLNGNQTHPYCQNIEEMISLYKHNLSVVTLYGPTNFSPVITSTANIAQQFQDGKNYFILLIITDGVISDMSQTKSAIINATRFPMSIIIVGVGNADFSAMDELDADDTALTVNNMKAERDIVQFVPLRNYLSQNGPWVQSKYELAQEVLREIPDQLVHYMSKKGFKP